jgi:hypothetical protein
MDATTSLSCMGDTVAMFGDNVGQDMSFVAIVAPRLAGTRQTNVPSHAKPFVTDSGGIGE